MSDRVDPPTTVPLGVLKSGDIEFIPKLPPLKLEAINNIGFGVVNKVDLRFEQPFWSYPKANETNGNVNSSHQTHVNNAQQSNLSSIHLPVSFIFSVSVFNRAKYILSTF